ncbi:hypothetical protein CCZ01_07445 [Helicobacter monodelphidis]|uniref:hypothetical protein n=1 Tax=Helicobacter sp. 15-1451 TaxID=2004995 RepID=UPI000DCC97DF|nr:hypothetical protein [Helicobacter sp. 15-1451]RAX57069.1 hypothetical protein CCZ01_07445 [Helicobacter sp. 15-1451]
MSVLSPIFIAPNSYAHQHRLKSFGNFISQEEFEIASKQTDSPSALVIFIGGFCDSFSRGIFNAFYLFQHQFFWKFYITFNGRSYFMPLIQECSQTNLPLFVIAHSWGANELLIALQKKQSCLIHYLLTLDAVGYRPILHRPTGIQYWENIFVHNHWTLINRANIAALIGHAKKNIALADCNTPIYAPFHHNSIHAMLNASKLQSKIIEYSSSTI